MTKLASRFEDHEKANKPKFSYGSKFGTNTSKPSSSFHSYSKGVDGGKESTSKEEKKGESRKFLCQRRSLKR